MNTPFRERQAHSLPFRFSGAAARPSPFTRHREGQHDRETETRIVRHEMVGAAIRSLLDAVFLPEQMLGAEATERIRALHPSEWYPASIHIDPVKRLRERVGEGSLKKVGWTLFALNHEAAIRARQPSVRVLLDGLNALYRTANRGLDIGGWHVTHVTPGEARLRKTTPHDCVIEEGILEAALRAVHVPAVIRQGACQRSGAAHCEFVITFHVSDKRWTG